MTIEQSCEEIIKIIEQFKEQFKDKLAEAIGLS